MAEGEDLAEQGKSHAPSEHANHKSRFGKVLVLAMVLCCCLLLVAVRETNSDLYSRRGGAEVMENRSSLRRKLYGNHLYKQFHLPFLGALEGKIEDDEIGIILHNQQQLQRSW